MEYATGDELQVFFYDDTNDDYCSYSILSLLLSDIRKTQISKLSQYRLILRRNDIIQEHS